MVAQRNKTCVFTTQVFNFCVILKTKAGMNCLSTQINKHCKLMITREEVFSLVSSNEHYPIDFSDAWIWLEYSRKDNAKVSFLGCGFTEGLDYRLLKIKETKPDGTFSHFYEDIRLTVECFKSWAMMSKTEVGKEVRKYFLECEKIAKDKQAQTATKELEAVDKVEAFGKIIDSIFSGLHIEQALIAGIKLNAAKQLVPSLAPQVEEARQLLINSTAKESKLMTVTELGRLMNPPLSAKAVNLKLINGGWQVKNTNKKSKKDPSYLPTDKAKDHCSFVLSTDSQHTDTYNQLRWYDTILSLI